MKNNKNLFSIKTVLFLCLTLTMFCACDKDDEQTYDKTRLFRPVLNQNLFANGNTIVVNMGKLKGAVGYTIEVSRDTFTTVEYTILTDTNYVEINKNTVGEELFWNSIYQVRATAHEAEALFDSKISDFGSVRTQRFPSILFQPKSYDVIDTSARLAWEPLGDAITGIKVFAPNDLRLETPLFPEATVTQEEFEAGETFVTGLQPNTTYQIAIYAGTELKGWVNYTTKVADIDPNGPGVIDIRADESPSAVNTALSSAPEGAIILVKRGITYDMPSTAFDKSVTIRAAYGFGKQKAKLFKDGNMNIASGIPIGYIRFVDLEVRGANYGGNYAFNHNSNNLNIGEILFDNCEVGTMRGIMRLRGDNVSINNFEIRNTVVDSIGGYGLLTCDTDGATAATINNIKFTNSTFNKIEMGIQSRTPSQSLIIESCTFANINTIFRYRGGNGNNDVTNGIEIKNTIFGHKWDPTGKLSGADLAVIGSESNGLGGTNFTVINTYTTTDFLFVSGKEIAEIPIGNAGTSQKDLWIDPEKNDFNFLNANFLGKTSAGDPRWRAKL
ncbi:DUF5123 domain-containing protein [Mariniflexile litorale]|uniref:DUF5123 domain-containing protein n=1 Tax=Mariniflexile litorale TaxID=3045158 RepID=A0AAU7EKW9_9FLAO|nr:DUF5123 domain-containing protein [Mariniflexile sp. KMM 9835]MDQ8210617.1 DUF4957 domain-containing protein [Mariniflexile sp. KMM 9835]